MSRILCFNNFRLKVSMIRADGSVQIGSHWRGRIFPNGIGSRSSTRSYLFCSSIVTPLGKDLEKSIRTKCLHFTVFRRRHKLRTEHDFRHCIPASPPTGLWWVHSLPVRPSVEPRYEQGEPSIVCGAPAAQGQPEQSNGVIGAQYETLEVTIFGTPPLFLVCSEEEKR